MARREEGKLAIHSNVHFNPNMPCHLTQYIVVFNCFFRFLLYDPQTKLWYDVGDEYAREKVSHSLRSRPNEQRRSKPKPRKKMVRKAPYSPALDAVVRRLIHDQQALLKSMIEKETSGGAVEATATSGAAAM
jgi:hypothetical protein